MSETSMSQAIVLVPGLGLGGAELFVLSRRLRKLGYAVILFRHFPWRGTLGEKANCLQSVVSKIPFGNVVLGKCMSTSCSEEGLPLPTHRDVGSIAGGLNLGIDWLLRLPRPNDSVVAVEETRRDEMQSMTVLNVSHTSMLVVSRVAREIDLFLSTSEFTGTAA